MSRVFSNTTNNDGLTQKFEEEIGGNFGDVSGNTRRLQSFVSATRTAWDRYLNIALNASGKWQYDDSAHTDYPIMYTDLVSGQRDYTFITDELGNLVLDIYNVAVLPSATATRYEELGLQVDQQTFDNAEDIAEENTNTGVPDKYDKTANGVFLDPPSSYNATNGLKVWLNRESSYFLSTDTTKKPGCPGIHHDYFFLRPALEYARRNMLSNYRLLQEEVLVMEDDIEKYFSRREKDVTHVLTPAVENNISNHNISF